jgi:hypothetical protein
VSLSAGRPVSECKPGRTAECPTPIDYCAGCAKPFGFGNRHVLMRITSADGKPYCSTNCEMGNYAANPGSR